MTRGTGFLARFFDFAKWVTIILLLFVNHIRTAPNVLSGIPKLPDTKNACKVVHNVGFYVKELIGLMQHVTALMDCVQICMKMDDCLTINYVFAVPDAGKPFSSGGQCYLSRANIKNYHSLHSIPNSIHAWFSCEDPNIKKPVFMTNDFHGGPPTQCGVLAFYHPVSTSPSLTSPQEYKRIIGGSKAPPFSQPWLGIMLVDRQIYCGISLVSTDDKLAESSTHFGITAAHCLIDESTNLKISTRNMDFLFGIHDVRFHSPHLVERKARKVILHPNYDSTISGDSDIAVVKFNKKIQFNDYIRPLCLPKLHVDPPTGTACLVCGFGKTEGKGDEAFVLSDFPNCFATKLLDSTQSPLLSPRRRPSKCYTSLVGLVRYKGAYTGDSGGPVSCLVRNKYTLFGIISSLYCSEPSIHCTTNIFTSASYFAPWIRDTIGETTEVTDRDED